MTVIKDAWKELIADYENAMPDIDHMNERTIVAHLYSSCIKKLGMKNVFLEYSLGNRELVDLVLGEHKKVFCELKDWKRFDKNSMPLATRAIRKIAKLAKRENGFAVFGLFMYEPQFYEEHTDQVKELMEYCSNKGVSFFCYPNHTKSLLNAHEFAELIKN